MDDFGGVGKACGLVLCAFCLPLLGGAMVVLVTLARPSESSATIRSLILGQNGIWFWIELFSLV